MEPESKKKIVSEILISLGTQLLPKVKVLISFPFIIKILGVEMYGMWAQIWAIIAFLAPFAFCGISVGVRRFLSAEKDLATRSAHYWAIVIIGFIDSIIIIGFIALLSEFITMHFFKISSADAILQAASIIIPLSILNQVFLEYFVAFSKIRTFGYLTVIRDLLEIFLLVYFLLNFSTWGVYILIAATIASLIVTDVIALYLIQSDLKFHRPDFGTIKTYLTVGFPLFLSGFAYTFIHFGDRYVIGFVKDLTSVAIYSGIYNVVSGVFFALSGSVFITLLPTLSRFWEAKKKDAAARHFAKLMKLYFVLGIPSIVGMTMLGKDILRMLANDDFARYWYLVPLIGAGLFIFQGFGMLEYIFTLRKNTRIILFLTGATAMVNFILNLFFVPMWGIVGAAVSSFICYSTFALIIYVRSKRFFSFSLDYSLLLKIILAATAMALVISFTALHGGKGWQGASVLLLNIILGMVVYGFFIVTLRIYSFKGILSILSFKKSHEE